MAGAVYAPVVATTVPPPASSTLHVTEAAPVALKVSVVRASIVVAAGVTTTLAVTPPPVPPVPVLLLVVVLPVLPVLALLLVLAPAAPPVPGVPAVTPKMRLHPPTPAATSAKIAPNARRSRLMIGR